MDNGDVYSATVFVKKLVARQQAHWKPVGEDDPLYMEYENPNQIGYAECSSCGVLTNNGGTENGYRFCPVCGAEMKGEK